MLNILTVVFITLKLTHYIDWSWFCVVAPTIIQTAIVLFAIGVTLISAAKRGLLK